MAMDESVRKAILGAVPSLRAFAISLCGNVDRADDLVQETLLRALANIDSFQPGTNMSAWLFTILRNHFRSEYRKRRREVEDSDGHYAETLKTQPEQYGQVEYREFREALSQLPQDQREALVLVGASGFSYEEAANICGCAVGTIKSRVNRARTRLAELMHVNSAEDFGPDEQVRAVLASEAGTAVGLLLGMLDVVRTRDEHTLIGTLGPDLLDDTFDADHEPFTGIPPGSAGPLGIDAPGGMPARRPGPGIDEALERWATRGATPVAEVLLDQHVVAGIGTIFMAESLFFERIWPWTPADQVRDPARLLRTARRLMAESFRQRTPPGRVHARDGLRCVRCGGLIALGQARKPPMQRPVYWCPRCQPAPRG